MTCRKHGPGVFAEARSTAVDRLLETGELPGGALDQAGTAVALLADLDHGAAGPYVRVGADAGSRVAGP